MSEQATTTCHVCGNPRREGVRFCGVCGTAAPTNGAQPPTVPLPSRAGDTGATTVAVAPRPRYAELLGVIALAAFLGPFLALWFKAIIKDDVPGYPNVVDFKVSLATFVMIMAVLQGLTASVFYGWIKTPWPSADAAAFFHRWSGRVIIPAALVVTVYCVKDIGPQSSPTRTAIHTILGSMVFIVLAAKLIILRAVPRLGGLLPVLGMIVVVSFIGLWATSSLYALRVSARGYSNANVGASVGIITDAQTIGRFDPAQTKVKVGQTVVWVNRDNAPHSVVAQSGAKFDSSLIPSGGGFNWPAKQAGTVTYRCTIHPQMAVATIVVED
jgi:plastocyanin